MDQSFNQPLSRNPSIDQKINKSTNITIQSINRPISPSYNPSINPTIAQRIDQSVDPARNQSPHKEPPRKYGHGGSDPVQKTAIGVRGNKRQRNTDFPATERTRGNRFCFSGNAVSQLPIFVRAPTAAFLINRFPRDSFFSETDGSFLRPYRFSRDRCFLLRKPMAVFARLPLYRAVSRRINHSRYRRIDQPSNRITDLLMSHQIAESSNRRIGSMANQRIADSIRLLPIW